MSLNLAQILNTNAKASREVGEVDENHGESRDVELVIAYLDVLEHLIVLHSLVLLVLLVVGVLRILSLLGVGRHLIVNLSELLHVLLLLGFLAFLCRLFAFLELDGRVLLNEASVAHETVVAPSLGQVWLMAHVVVFSLLRLLSCLDMAPLITLELSLGPALVVDPAEELIAALVHFFDLKIREIKVDRQDHHFVLLNSHHDGEDNKAR